MDFSLGDTLSAQGVALSLGAARVRVRTDVAGLVPALERVYAGYPLEPATGFCDATVEVRRVDGLRRHLRPQIRLVVDAQTPFEPFPACNHLPLLEWGMNFALAERFLHAMLLHAGVVAWGGRAVVMPAIPGSGKSTLTAALMCHGFRLLSDEFGVVDLDSGELCPMVRPVALKNASIEVIARFWPSAILGPVFDKTRKGRVAHLAPSADSVAHRLRRVAPALILFPQYRRGAALKLEHVDTLTAFGKLCVNSFNYEFLGPRSFDAVSRLVRQCDIRRLEYSDLGEAVDVIKHLVDGQS